MSQSTQWVKTILHELNEDIRLYSGLADDLKQQYGLLMNRDTQALMAHNAKMSPVMSTLNDHAEQRMRLLRQLGLSADSSGMETLLAKLPEPTRSKSLTQWQQLYELTVKCQSLNDANGRLLSQQKQMIDRLINPAQEHVYGPSL